MASTMATTMAATASSISTSAPLPDRLMRFFARYPPKLYSAKYTGASIPLERRKPLLQKGRSSRASTSTGSTFSTSQPPSTDPNWPLFGSETPSSATTITTTTTPSPSELPPNPFLPWRNPETSRWRAPQISLRRQAELVKLARTHGVEPLLPPSRKSSAFKEARMLEKGLRVRGTGEGQKVKGHKWERQMPAKLEARRKAMEGMPILIRKWQRAGHGRGWKKYPKK